MAAAAANLCPVTLELGGKSPAIVCDDFPLRTAAERILFVKCLNAGQICTTVDHVSLPREQAGLRRLAAPDRAAALPDADLARLHLHHRPALVRAPAEALDDARARGATLVPLLPGPAFDPTRARSRRTWCWTRRPDCALMQREIFGPILPVLGYRHAGRGDRAHQRRPAAAGALPVQQRRATVRALIERVMSGGVTVNDALFHVGQHDLPFGGVGAIGHGPLPRYEGFETFSKLRPVFYQARLSPLRWR
jgi:coniferyl-aldehyde dehydrogenase